MYGYGRRSLAAGIAPYKLMYGMKPRMPLEFLPPECKEGTTINHRRVQVMALTVARATQVCKSMENRKTVVPSHIFNVGDTVLVAKEKYIGAGIKWSTFTSKFYDPGMVTAANHPRCDLTSGHNHHTQTEIYARRLHSYLQRAHY